MCFNFNSVFLSICLSVIFNLLKKPEIKKENSIKKNGIGIPKDRSRFFGVELLFSMIFFPNTTLFISYLKQPLEAGNVPKCQSKKKPIEKVPK